MTFPGTSGSRMLVFMRFGRFVSWIFLAMVVPGVSSAQEEDSALSDYVRFYRRFLDRGPGEGGCAMYPSCSRYGLMVFRDCYFPRAMVLMADRMIRCGHDFDAYRLTLQGGRLFMLDLPPYAKGAEGYVYDGREYYAHVDGGTRADSTLLFVNSLINRKMYREALLEIERAMFRGEARGRQWYVNKLVCYKGLDLLEDAIYDYEVRFPGWARKEAEVAFEMAGVYLLTGNHARALEVVEGVASDGSEEVDARKCAWRGIVLAKEGRWEEAGRALEELARRAPEEERDARNARLVGEALAFKGKKRGVAMALSVVPGLGYIYTGRPKSALTAFVMNALLGYGVYTSARKENYGVAALLGVFNLSFYVGNVSGAGRAALQYNQRKLEKIQSSLYRNNEFIN